jgi:transposase
MTYNPKHFDIFIGIDVDQKSFSFTVKDHEHMNISKRIPADPENLYHYITDTYNTKKIICAYEVGGTGYRLYDYLASRDIPCLMVPPPSMPKPANARVKNNRLDSDKIAKSLKSGELPSIRIPDQTYRDLRHLLRCREDYVNDGRVAKQRIKALLLYAGLHESIKEPSTNWSNPYIQALKELACPTEATRQRLDMLLTDLSYHRQQNVKILKELRAFCKQHPMINQHLNYLRSIPGIGFITGISLLGYIGDPLHLHDPRELAGFIGLVPREHSTGDRIRRGGITHLGPPILRSLLIEAAWAAKNNDKRLELFYDRIHSKNKHDSGIAARKAIVAVARKLTMIIYRVLKEQRNYIKY